MTRDPSVRASADESPAPSSASDSGSTLSGFVTRHDFQRVKRRLGKMNEHLRDPLQSTKHEFWESIDDEAKEREQESTLFKRLLDDRTDAIAQAVRANLDGLRDEMLSLIEPTAQLTEGWQKWEESIELKLEHVKQRTDPLEANLATVTDRAEESLEHVITNLAELQNKSQSDWSDWSLADTDEYQDLKARVEALEAGNPSVPDFGAEVHSEEFLRDLSERVADLESEGPRGLLGAGAGLPLKIPTLRP